MVLPEYSCSRHCYAVAPLHPSRHVCKSSWSIPHVRGFESESTCLVKFVFAAFVDGIGDRCCYCLK